MHGTECGCAQPVNEAGSPRAKLDCAHVTRGRSSRHRAVNGVPACSWLGQAYVPRARAPRRIEFACHASRVPSRPLVSSYSATISNPNEHATLPTVWDSIADGDNRDEMKHACYNSGSSGTARTFEQTHCEHVVRVSRIPKYFSHLMPCNISTSVSLRTTKSLWS